jgi:hypothetical protein
LKEEEESGDNKGLSIGKKGSDTSFKPILSNKFSIIAKSSPSFSLLISSTFNTFSISLSLLLFSLSLLSFSSSSTTNEESSKIGCLSKRERT